MAFRPGGSSPFSCRVPSGPPSRTTRCPKRAIARCGNGRRLHGGVSHTEFAPDGKTLATSGDDGARLWDVKTGAEIPLAYLPRTGYALLTFTPDGEYLVADDQGCRVYRATGKVRCFWRNAGKRPVGVIVAADGKTAATAWDEGGVSVHDLTGEGRRVGRQLNDNPFPRYLNNDSPLALSGDGSLLACANAGAIELWDVRAGRLLHTYCVENTRAVSFSLRRDGRRLAAVFRGEANFLVWDTQSHAAVPGFVPPTKVRVELLRYSADGAELVGVTGKDDREVWRWAADTGKELAHVRLPAKKEYDRLSPLTLSPDGRTLAGVEHWESVTLWDAASWRELLPLQREPDWGGAAFVQPGVLATWTRGEKPEVVAFWDASTGRQLRRHTIAVPEDHWWRRALSPDGTVLAAGDHTIRLFDVVSGRELRQLEEVPDDARMPFAFSPDGKTLVAEAEKGLQLWDVTTGKALYTLQGARLGTAAFSPDGRLIASGYTWRVVLSEVAGGNRRWQMELPDYEGQVRDDKKPKVRQIRFTRDGRLILAVTSSDLLVYSTRRGDVVFRQHLGVYSDDSHVEPAAISPDGRWLVHANRRDVLVRDMANPTVAAGRSATRSVDRQCQTLAGHAADVTAIEFSPEGKFLVTCSSDGTALVWDPKRLTGKPAPVGPDDYRTASDVARDLREDAVRHWEALAGADAAKASRALADLEDLAEVTVPLIRERLKPVEAPPPGRIARLVADLDSEVFAERESARKELSRYAEQAVPELWRALAGNPSPELTVRANQLLDALRGPETNPERLRALRAVELLERLGTPDARKLLEALAAGAPSAMLTMQAKAALARWPTR